MRTVTERSTTEILAHFAERSLGAIDRVTVTPLSGGLDCCGIYRVEAVLSASPSRERTTFVAKHLRGRGVRELDVYRALRSSRLSSAGPRLLGMHRENRDEVFIFLECVRAIRHWPWADMGAALLVLRQLASLHSVPVNTVRTVFDDPRIGQEIAASAVDTAEFYHRSALARAPHGTRPMHRAIDRIAADLGRIRLYLMAHTGVAVLHGDVHSGNVMIRAVADRAQAVLLDWGRARLGSPLEDVASWLQSLSYWEPQVARRHDSLLSRYLGWTHRSCAFDADLRTLYWLAAASNAMAGALRYHLAGASDASRSQPARERSVRAARYWLRVIRRADERWSRINDRGRRTG